MCTGSPTLRNPGPFAENLALRAQSPLRSTASAGCMSAVGRQEPGSRSTSLSGSSLSEVSGAWSGSVVARRQTRPQPRPQDACPLRDCGRGLVVGGRRRLVGSEQRSPFLTGEFDHAYCHAGVGRRAPMAAGTNPEAMRRAITRRGLDGHRSQPGRPGRRPDFHPDQGDGGTRHPTAVRTTAVAADTAGAARLFLDTWLRRSAETPRVRKHGMRSR